MTVEYVLLLFVVFLFVLKGLTTAPANAFREAGPRLAARIEQQIETGSGFKPETVHKATWGKAP